MHYRIIRDYGHTAREKVNELVGGLVVAVLTVVVLVAIFIGWRAALIVALAVPICYGITQPVDLFTGYTINRVTLFALILALGLLVDDPITGVDNIERYLRMGRFEPLRAVVSAITEIRGPLIMATVAIVIAFAPMSFITGMMGPYMAPMALNVPVAAIVSTFVAFIVTPWLAYRMLPHQPPEVVYDVKRTPIYRIYSRAVRPLIRSRARAWAFLGAVAVVFVAAVSLPAFRLVPLKLLPYENKDNSKSSWACPRALPSNAPRG